MSDAQQQGRALAVDAEVLPVEEAAGLVVKAVGQQGLVEGAHFAGAAGVHDTVDGAGLVLDAQGVDLNTGLCRPLFGVCIKDGQYAFVIHPQVYTFEELRVHGLLSAADVQALTAAADRVKRQSNRLQLRLQRRRQARAQGLDVADPAVARWIAKSDRVADMATAVLGGQGGLHGKGPFFNG